MKLAERITPEKLKNLFLEEITKSKKFSFLDGIQPFLITFSGCPYYVYIKHLSSAYFKDRPDTTRAQLPVRPDFDEIKKSSIPFIFLGYDVVNDVYVCWNYHIAKNRLNEKESVSFYSRKSFQDEVQKGSFLRKKLKNDDVPVLFKRGDIISFFENIDSFFNISELGIEIMHEDRNYERDGKLFKITEPDLLERIRLVVNEESNNILEGITIAKNYYGNRYPNMKYSDWSNLIKGTRQLKEEDTPDNFKDLYNNPELRIDIGNNSDRVVAEKYHCSTADVCRLRNQLGIEPYRKKEGGKIPKDAAQILSDYNRLGSLQKVADVYGCSKQALSLRLKKDGIELKKNENESITSIFDSLAFESNKKFITSIFDYLFENKIITEDLLYIFCNKVEIDKAMGVANPNPVLLQISDDKDLKSQVFISGQSRYYTDHIYEYSGNHYVASSQWYGPNTTKTDTKTPFINFIKQYLK